MDFKERSAGAWRAMSMGADGTMRDEPVGPAGAAEVRYENGVAIVDAGEAAELCPESVALGVAVRPEDGTITDVGPYRHSVRWTDSGASSVTYCNHCGGSFLAEGVVSVAGESKRARICAQCRMFQGFV